MGAKSLDPITLAVLTAAMVAAASELASECIHALLAKDVRNPTLRQRLRVRWHYARRAVNRAIAARTDADHVDAWHVADLTAKGLLAAGATLTDSEFAALKKAA